MWRRPLEWNLNGTTDPRDGSVDHLSLNSLKDRHGPIRAPKSRTASASAGASDGNLRGFCLAIPTTIGYFHLRCRRPSYETVRQWVRLRPNAPIPDSKRGATSPAAFRPTLRGTPRKPSDATERARGALILLNPISNIGAISDAKRLWAVRRRIAMSDTTASETPFAPRAHEPVRVEADACGFYWRNRPENTLPPPDLVSAYNRNKPLARAGVEKRKAYIVGSGIAGLAAAFYLIRDGHMPGRNITILDSVDVAGGSLDGAGDAETGYIMRGGREMCFTYENFWDVFQDVPALELPEGYSVLDEYRLLNDNDPTYSKARLMHRQGQIKDFSTFGLSRSQQWELTRLLFKRKEELDDTTVEQYFSKGLLESNFWVFWRTMFAFQNWHSLLEMKLYMHRFLDLIDGLQDMSSLVFPKYDQYDSFVRPLIAWLSEKGVQTQFSTRVHDLAVEIEGERKTVTKILCMRDGRSETIPVGPEDIVIALTGSMTEGTAYGDLDTVPTLAVDRRNPGPESGWTLWRNLAAKSPAFGKPEKFYGDVDRSIWESATLTCKPSPLVDKLKELAVNDPYSSLPRFAWQDQDRRRDFSRLWGSAVRASMIFQP